MPLAPVLKWVGGKSKLLPELLSRVPKTYRHYYEPFLGGGALFFALEPERATVGDLNPALIETYLAIAHDTRAVIARLEVLKRTYVDHGKPFYYEVRETWNANGYRDSVALRAAAFIFLNKTCFNGLWRVNKSGGFNVPAGDVGEAPAIYDEDDLRDAAKLLGRADVKNLPYDQTTANAGRGDFLYFDPPYDPLDKTSNFTAYTKEGFGDDQQAALAEHARKLRKRGAFVMLSNNDTPMIRDLYRDFTIDTVRCGRSINSKGDKRGKINEVLIIGQP
jgi:DNA adenine methylase